MKHDFSDMEARIREILSSAGLVFDDLDFFGEMAYCGTTKKPYGTDGRYVVHLDFPPNVSFTNYHEGGEWQKVGLWEKSDLEAMPAAEREALQERIRQEKEKRKQETERKRQEAAREAKRLFSKLPLAGEKNPYLSHKGAFAVGKVRCCDASASPFSRVFAGELLVLPVRDAGGEIVSLQFIGRTREGGFSKRFQPGGKPAGCYCPIPAKDEGKEGPLLVCEGYATGASLHMATGYAVLVAFSAGNLEAVASMARGRYPEREIILCADNDCETKGNPGKEAATRAARAVGGKLALCPAHEGKATDFNDLHQYRSLEAVQQVVEKARETAVLLSEKTSKYRCLNIAELITKDYPPRDMILAPVLAVQSLSMIFAMRGVGKTFFAMSCAYAVASGGGVFGRWFAPRPARVLYIDGEMPAVTLKERFAHIAKSAEEDITDPDMLRILTPDEQESPMPNLGTKEGQEAVEPFLDGVALVVVDNIATLARTGKANDEDSWMPVQEWLLALRRRGISVLLVHHAGKNGSQRGTGAKEDILDTVMELKRPSDYRAEQGARFEVHFTKARGLCGEDTEPFEAMLTIDEHGQCSWTTRKVEDLVESRVLELLKSGFSEREIVEELKESHIGRTRVRKIRQEFEAGGMTFAKSKGGFRTHKDKGQKS